MQACVLVGVAKQARSHMSMYVCIDIFGLGRGEGGRERDKVRS